MELGHWQRQDSDYDGSEDSGDGISDDNCAGCSRIMREEEEKRRIWREGKEGQSSGEDGPDSNGKLEVLPCYHSPIRSGSVVYQRVSS